jgi:hypothetical protein
MWTASGADSGITAGTDTDDPSGGPGEGGASESDSSGACEDGTACEGGGICAAGECCAPERACDDGCCPEGEVCSFHACVTSAGPCLGSEDCPAGHYCELAGASADVVPGCIGGIEGVCLPAPPVCGPDDDAGDGTCIVPCEVMPDASDLSPVLRHEVEGGAYTAPIVIELDDDDCDGQVNARDIPEIAWTALLGSYTENANGEIRVVSIIDGTAHEKWRFAGTLPVGQLAGGNIDGAPGNEIVACNNDLSVVALRGDGSMLWKAAPGTCGVTYSSDAFPYSVPAIADLDEDGVPEVITERAILDGATGQAAATYSALPRGSIAVSDVDGDGFLDIVSGGQAWDRNGQLIADTTWPNAIWPAIGDLDGDTRPEIVTVDFDAHRLSIWRVGAAGAEVVRQGIDVLVLGNGACTSGAVGMYGHAGGPPTIGDFDGDGTADVALAGGAAYVVYDGARLMDPSAPADTLAMWAAPTVDCSSAQTGSTLFDFNGDGKAEVVYADEQQLYIYDGPTGNVVAQICHRNGTINEYPVVADVDADGKADIVAVSSAGCEDGTPGGLRVFTSAADAWVRTRRVWNQFTYHVTNVDEGGAIPSDELPNWMQPGLNNFRQNKAPGGEFHAADVTVELTPRCEPDAFALVATVRNVGQAPIPAGAVVTFAVEGESIGEATTTLVLYPAQAESLVLELEIGAGVGEATASVEAPVAECRGDNNASEPVSTKCVPAG